MTVSPSPTTLQVPEPPKTLGGASEADYKARTLVTLRSYHSDGVLGRQTGDNPRETVWRQNVDLYWNRFDFSKKADWQSKEVIPEVPQFVDRFAAAMSEALQAAEGFYTLEVPGDAEQDLGRALKRLNDHWLSSCGRTEQGHPLPFTAVFKDLMKLGALMSVDAMVTPKKDQFGNTYVAVEAIDPRFVWLDPSRRGMFRIRRVEIDKNDLISMAKQERAKGQPLYDLDAIEACTAEILTEEQKEAEKLAGHAMPAGLPRKPIILDEYLCTVLDEEGKSLSTNTLLVVLNERHIVRGPEANPFWHKMDWIVSAPLISVPLSVYGKSYVENFAGLAMAYNDLTNLLLDAAQTSSIKAFAMVEDMLKDPTQANEGVYPNVTFKLEDGADANKFLQAVELGKVSPDAVAIWQQLKSELREAASFNEISLGGFAPKGRTSASEIVASQQNSSELIRDITRNIEQRVLEPLLNLVWMTGLQFMPASDPALEQIVGGKEMYEAIYTRRKEFITSPATFKARGLSAMVAKQQQLRNLVQILSVIAQNETLAQVFLQETDPKKLINVLFTLSDIDIDKLRMSLRDKSIAALEAQSAQMAGMVPGAEGALPAGPNPPGGNPVEAATGA